MPSTRPRITFNERIRTCEWAEEKLLDWKKEKMN